MPEKTLSQIPRPLREQYEKGKAALDRQNYDYAVAIFSKILEQEAAFFDCRQALRVSQHKKAEHAGTTFFKRILSGAASSPLFAKGQLALRMQPLDALKIAEQILNNDAHSAQGHKLLADAAMLSDLPKTAALSLEILAKQSPKDEGIQKDLARAYAKIGQGEKAEHIFDELIRLHPGDLELMEERKNLSARRSLAEGGYDALSEGKGSYRDILKDKEEAVALEQAQRQVRTEDLAQKMIDQLRAKLAAEPNNLNYLQQLGELHTKKNEFDLALKAYRQLLQMSGAGDPTVQKTIAEVTVKKFDHALQQLDPQSPDYAQQAAQIKSQRDQFLLQECKQRADQYPNDLAIRFELGQLYFEAGKITEAIQEFQKAQNNPHKRIQALTFLGHCFAHRKMYDLAARQFQTALKEKLVFDDERKEIIYALGTVYEKMANKEKAIEQFKQIYEVDAGFKDVAAKVEGYYGGA